MKQKHVSHLIDDYIDGVLNAEERKLVELHIKECPQCRKELSELEAVVHDLQSLPKSITPPEKLQTAINQKLLQYGSNHHAARNRVIGGVKILRSPWVLRIAAGFAVLIGAGIVMWFSLHKNAEVETNIAQKIETSLMVHSAQPDSENVIEGTEKSVLKSSERRQHVVQVAPVSAQKDSALPALVALQPPPMIPDTQVSVAAVETPSQAKTPARHKKAGNLTGKILDSSTGESLIGANVVIMGTSLGASSDINGEFNIINIPKGTYNLSVSSVGYEKKTLENISIQSDSTHQLDFRIVPQAIAAQEVLVTAQRQRPNAAISLSTTSSVVSLEKIKALPDASSVAVSGLTSRYSNVTIDGIRVPSASLPPFNTEEYSKVNENEFKDALTNPFSTFSIDVDVASYGNVRRFIRDGSLPPIDAVRTEEFVNYFTYHYPEPNGKHPFSVTTELASVPWNPSHRLLMIGLQGKHIATENLPPSNLTFLLDVSGSMEDPNKLPLVKSAFRLLVNQLRSIDRVAIVVYAGNAGMVLPSTSGNEKSTILNAIDNLQAGGSTAGGEGIVLAYKIAKENFLKDGNNQVILATDGDFNIGSSSDSEMERLIEEKRNDGIYLTVLGFGMGNYKDSKMEILADKGNGNYAYIDNILEAKKVFVGQLTGTLYTIAKDVKLQVEFNPALVKAYRLIGYENRLLNKEDFNNDKKDAGEIGAGHSVTAFYEIVPVGVPIELPKVDSLKYQHFPRVGSASQFNELLTVKIRYKLPKDTTSILQEVPVQNKILTSQEVSKDFQFASAVVEFCMILRESKFKRTANYDHVLECARSGKGEDKEGYQSEFIQLVEMCKELPKRPVGN